MECGVKNNYSVSIRSLLETARSAMPRTEIATVEEGRSLLRALSFKFGNLHSDHYQKVGHRQDVLTHRSLFAPFYHSILESPRAFVTCADASFYHENAHSKRAWFPQDVKDSDLVPAKAGTGLRLNVWEFVTENGLLAHPDGTPFPCPSPLDFPLISAV